MSVYALGNNVYALTPGQQAIVTMGDDGLFTIEFPEGGSTSGMIREVKFVPGK